MRLWQLTCTAAVRRVCVRYSGHASVTLNGVILDTSVAGNYDATLVCHDVPYLPAGLLPLSVQFASGPNDVNNVFQFWIIPVKSVTQVADPVSRPATKPLSGCNACSDARVHTVQSLEAEVPSWRMILQPNELSATPSHQDFWSQAEAAVCSFPMASCSKLHALQFSKQLVGPEHQLGVLAAVSQSTSCAPGVPRAAVPGGVRVHLLLRPLRRQRRLLRAARRLRLPHRVLRRGGTLPTTAEPPAAGDPFSAAAESPAAESTTGVTASATAEPPAGFPATATAESTTTTEPTT